MLTGTRKTLRLCLTTVFGLLVLAVLGFLAGGEKFLQVDSRPPNHGVDAVVVLAGAYPEDKHRIERALEILRQQHAGVLILPLRHPSFRWSWAVAYYRLPLDAVDRTVLIGRSTASETPWLDDYGGTYTEARKTLEIMQRNQLDSAIIVSSAYHMRRARLAFSSVAGPADLQLFYRMVNPGRKEFSPWWMNWQRVKKILGEYRKLVAAYWLYSRE